MGRNRGASFSPCSGSRNCSRRRAPGRASTMLRKPGYSAAELLTILSARQLSDGQVVFAGVGIPLLAATLAQRLRCPGLTILFEGGVIGAFIEPGKLPPSTNDQRCTKRANMVLGSAEVLLLLHGGTFRVVTDLAVLGFDADERRKQVMSLNPGVSREELQDNTGFVLAFAPHLGVTEPPTDQELELLRELDPDRLYTG